MPCVIPSAHSARKGIGASSLDDQAMSTLSLALAYLLVLLDAIEQAACWRVTTGWANCAALALKLFESDQTHWYNKTSSYI